MSIKYSEKIRSNFWSLCRWLPISDPRIFKLSSDMPEQLTVIRKFSPKFKIKKTFCLGKEYASRNYLTKRIHNSQSEVRFFPISAPRVSTALSVIFSDLEDK